MRIALSVIAVASCLMLVAGEKPHCMEFYRPDVMQTWAVRKGAALCQINKLEYGATQRIGLKADTTTSDLVLNLFGGDPQSISKHWRTPSFELGGKFGIVYYQPNSSVPQILRLNQTNQLFRLDEFDYEESEGINSFKRTYFYYMKDDLVVLRGNHNAAINWAMLCAFILFVLLAGLHFHHFPPAVIAISLTVMLAAICEGSLTLFAYPLVLICFLLLLFSGTSGLAYLLHQKAKQVSLWLSFACVVAMMAFVFINRHQTWRALLAAGVMQLLPVFFIVNYRGRKLTDLLDVFGSLGSLFAVITLSIPIVAFDYPGAFFKTVVEGAVDYKYQTKEAEVQQTIYITLGSILMMVVELFCGVMLKHKLNFVDLISTNRESLI